MGRVNLAVEDHFSAILVPGDRFHEVEVEAFQRCGRGRLPGHECGGTYRHAAGRRSRAGQRAAGNVESLASAAADAGHAARPGGVKLARDVVHVEVFEHDVVVGNLLPVAERLVDDVNALAAVDRFHECRLLERRLLLLALGKVDAMVQADVHRVGSQQLRLAADLHLILEVGGAAVEGHRLLPIDAERARMAQRPVVQVAVEGPFQSPGAVHHKPVRAAVDGDARAGEGHASAFHVGRPAEHGHFGPWRVGVDGVQRIARDDQRQIARLRGLRLLQMDAIDHLDFSQIALLAVAKSNPGFQQTSADLHVRLPRGGSGRRLGEHRRRLPARRSRGRTAPVRWRAPAGR